MAKTKIIVIGSGPAGMMAAGQAAMAGVETLLIEKKRRPGRKLCITGKGRCNLTNTTEFEDFLPHFGEQGDFLRRTFSQFCNKDLINFLEQNGLKLVTERGGRVFPASGKATDVLAALMRWVADCGVYLKYATSIEKLLLKDGRVVGVVSRGRKFSCAAVVLATGGASYPATGSTGEGYRIAASVGHTIVPIRPALVPLTIEGNSATIMDGINLRNVNARLLIDGEMRREVFGEVAFTKTGMGGPAILTLSGPAVDAIDAGRKVSFSLDLKPALSEKKLDARISRDLSRRGAETFKSFLRGLLPRQVVTVCLIQTGISGKRIVDRVTAVERKRLVRWLKDARLEVTGYRPFSEAIITAGGIATDEIDPQTLESRLVDGLYVAGEVLDINADTGGYNLQAAFSTGWLAGRSAAAAILKD
jgi:predicted Rossmann fold flavoprotein